MDVVNAEQVRCCHFEPPSDNSSFTHFICYINRAAIIQARIAEEAGACAVMALERVPADIRREGGVARMVPSNCLRILPLRC